MRATKSRQIRARLDHPVIDADGHTLELTPVLVDYIKDIGGSDMASRYLGRRSGYGVSRWDAMSQEERRDTRTVRPPWWALPTGNTLDRATASLPRLLSERMDDLGMDLTVLYPTGGLGIPEIRDEDLRRVACRALNAYHADLFRPYADRMVPVAVIPMHSPREAIEELDHAVKVLGMKAMMILGYVRRPIPSVQRRYPEMAREVVWLDTFGLDSEHDYDPLWARCVELRIAVASHGAGEGPGWGNRRSISTYMYNQIGKFGAAGEAFCKSLFFGGVTRRHPTLRFAFLEGGVGWACSLYADIIGRWQKRNRNAIQDLDPGKLDVDLLLRLLGEYGDERARGKSDQIRDSLARDPHRPLNTDEWAACGIDQARDIHDLFVPSFYFGCEADDPMNVSAFNAAANPFGARLRAMFGSDIGHWDVPDMTKVLEEAYEPVERGLITPQDFRDFAFANAVRFYAGVNPKFFEGTRCEAEAREMLTSDPAAASPVS